MFYHLIDEFYNDGGTLATSVGLYEDTLYGNQINIIIKSGRCDAFSLTENREADRRDFFSFKWKI